MAVCHHLLAVVGKCTSGHVLHVVGLSKKEKAGGGWGGGGGTYKIFVFVSLISSLNHLISSADVSSPAHLHPDVLQDTM